MNTVYLHHFHSPYLTLNSFHAPYVPLKLESIHFTVLVMVTYMCMVCLHTLLSPFVVACVYLGLALTTSAWEVYLGTS